MQLMEYYKKFMMLKLLGLNHLLGFINSMFQKFLNLHKVVMLKQIHQDLQW